MSFTIYDQLIKIIETDWTRIGYFLDSVKGTNKHLDFMLHSFLKRHKLAKDIEPNLYNYYKGPIIPDPFKKRSMVLKILDGWYVEDLKNSLSDLRERRDKFLEKQLEKKDLERKKQLEPEDLERRKESNQIIRQHFKSKKKKYWE